MNNRMNAIEGEVWKPVVGYESRYLVSNMGRVFSLIKDKMLKQIETPYGYLVVNLYDGNKMKQIRVHRLVAMAFIPNPDSLPQVNHIDEDKHNNYIDNLEWCNAKYNANYGTRNERLAKTLSENKTLPIGQYDLNWNLIRVFPDAESFEGTPYHRPSCKAVSSTGETLYGFKWKTLKDVA